MNVTFTLATPDDAELLIALMREFYAVEHLAFDEPRARDAAQQILRHRAHGVVQLMRAGEQSLGYLVLTFGFSLEFGGRFALLDELYLRKDFRGRGIGRASLDWVEAFCRRESIGVVRLEVDRDNARAQQLYRQNAYRGHNRDLLTKVLRTEF